MDAGGERVPERLAGDRIRSTAEDLLGAEFSLVVGREAAARGAGGFPISSLDFLVKREGRL